MRRAVGLKPTVLCPAPSIFYFLSHLFRAAFSAISRRRSGVMDAALAAPPIRPPLRPKADITLEISDCVGNTTGPGSSVSALIE